MIRRLIGVVVCSFLLLLAPMPAEAAQILQVRSSSLLLIGDGNRTYTVRLACLDVDPVDEQAAVEWLRSALPRHKRVNLRPQGSTDGVLLARVAPIGDSEDLSVGLVDAGLAQLSCESELA
ncbi:MAG: nuclease [Prochlorococcus sp.]|nr:nuclease [Prochlorococcaceae cyanobacterium Fu_MAG_50]